MKIYLNGELVDKEKAVVSVYDHGLLYGDGVFEGIRLYNGRVFRLEEHLDRLYRSARAILLSVPLDKPAMTDAVIQTCRANNLTDGYIRLVVTRGPGDLGLDPRKCPKPSMFIIADKIQLYPEEYYRNGLELIIVPTRRNSIQALSPCIKSLNYLNNILAKIESVRAGAPEAIMLNTDGQVAECTGDNIFIIKGRKLITPPTWSGALEGITRDAVMEIGRKELGLEVLEGIMTPYDLYTADEAFLTGTAAEVVPVVKIDTRAIGNGKPGVTTLALMKEFHELTRTTGTPLRQA